MNWELYEVWSVDEDGAEDLVNTTASLKEAKAIAEDTLSDDYYVECIIYAEDQEGELIEIERILGL